jgi:hypothetical protein
MSNMSYCRFNNTFQDLQDCLEALENREISNGEEKQKAKGMIVEFLDFCLSEQIIETYNLGNIQDMIEECE